MALCAHGRCMLMVIRGGCCETRDKLEVMVCGEDGVRLMRFDFAIDHGWCLLWVGLSFQLVSFPEPLFLFIAMEGLS
ncbi:hypothetical protein E2542_SST25333 [Spatholobus suberectus]|nr:hypothetical protein E2542_SST25333 [Spatholobus suberectus]